MKTNEALNKWTQVYNHWKATYNEVINNIPFEEIGTGSSKDKLRELFAIISIKMQEINRITLKYHYGKKNVIPKKMDDLKLF